MFTQNPNLARCKLIADTHAKDARGAVTGVSRNFFALGQAISPMLSGVLFTLNPLAPYAATCVFLVANICIFFAFGVPLTRDPAVRAIVISTPLEGPAVSTPAAAACTAARAQVAHA
jgi:MFS family permease